MKERREKYNHTSVPMQNSFLSFLKVQSHNVVISRMLAQIMHSVELKIQRDQSLFKVCTEVQIYLFTVMTQLS